MTERSNLEVPVVDSRNAEVGRVTLPSAFGGDVRDPVMFEQVVSQMAGRRGGNAATKTRSEVRGGGKKPWNQKGSGRARAGSNRSPIWRGGGVSFGPNPRSYLYRLPRSARKAALASALAQKVRDGQLRIVDDLKVTEPKTKVVRQTLATLGIKGSVLIVCASDQRNLELGARNIPYTTVTRAAGLNVYDILKHEILLVQRDALTAIEERCAP